MCCVRCPAFGPRPGLVPHSHASAVQLRWQRTDCRTPAAVQILAAACKELQAAYGRILWAKVAERLPGRTDSQCARAYDNLVKHKRVRDGGAARPCVRRHVQHAALHVPVCCSAVLGYITHIVQSITAWPVLNGGLGLAAPFPHCIHKGVYCETSERLQEIIRVREAHPPPSSTLRYPHAPHTGLCGHLLNGCERYYSCIPCTVRLRDFTAVSASRLTRGLSGRPRYPGLEHPVLPRVLVAVLRLSGQMQRGLLGTRQQRRRQREGLQTEGGTAGCSSRRAVAQALQGDLRDRRSGEGAEHNAGKEVAGEMLGMGLQRMPGCISCAGPLHVRLVQH